MPAMMLHRLLKMILQTIFKTILVRCFFMTYMRCSFVYFLLSAPPIQYTETSSPSPSSSTTPEPKLDDIQVQYHPKSGRPMETSGFSEFKRQQEQKKRVPDETPWRPFFTRADFEFSEIVLDAAMNEKQINALIKLFRHCLDKNESYNFTLQDHRDYKAMWDGASKHLTPAS